MLRIGTIELATPFCQAGLAGYSDRAMRVVARRRGCPYAVTEALLDTIMVNGGEGLRRSIDINDEDHPVAGQIMGSEPGTMSRAAQLLHERSYDVIDLNFACPVKKIKNKARGGHMLLDDAMAISILRAVRDALPPAAITTISMRRGFDDSPESEERFYRIADAAFEYGYSAIRCHARTVEQKYLGQSRWDFLRAIKQRYPDNTILGSGDVFTAEDAVRMLHETGVDIVWIARGAIGNPWIFQQSRTLLNQRATQASRLQFAAHLNVGATPASPSSDLQPPSIHTQRDALAEHFSIAMEIHGEQLAGRRMRKMGIKYSRFHPAAGEVKHQFINVRSLRDWTNVLDNWYATDGPGAWPTPDAVDEVNAGEGCEAA
jgi:tRNA-dihydrouridine synthase B